MRNTIFLAAIAGLVFLSGCVNFPGQSPAVVVAEEHKACNVNEDCTPISIDCGYCTYDAANKSYSSIYKTKLEMACKNYRGIACDMGPPVVECVNNKCQKVEAPKNPPSNLEEYYASIDYSCNTDSDCEIKDVHNCCGFYPECTNKNAITDPDKVREFCASEGLSSVCGFPTIYACDCVQNKCKGILEQTRIETQEQCLQAGGFWREHCGLMQDCCNFKTTDFEQACSDTSQCQGKCLVETNESTSGTCSQWKTTFGCYSYLDDGEIAAVCVD